MINKTNIKQLRYLKLLAIFSLSVFWTVELNRNHVLAQSNIVPDETLGNEKSRVVPFEGNNAIDIIQGGAIRDSNLFHSFKEFNIGEGRGAYFFSPNAEIQNILTRVTGSNRSEILGTLGTFGNSQPNLFLINPNGIVFGENASLDVGGSFVATTANGIEFGEQGLFSASNPETPRLLNVSPSALFFNAVNNQAGIQNNSTAPAGTNPAGIEAFGLRVADGKSLLLVGGNVSMDGGELNAYGGRVELGGLAAPGNVNLLFEGDNLKLGFPENVTRADVSLTNQAFVFVEANGGGDIAVNARNLDILQGSQLFAGIGQGLGTPDAVAGDITLNATGDIKVAGAGSRVGNIVSFDSQGNGGNITINSGSLLLQDGAELRASTYGKGDAGNVQVKAKDAVSLAGNALILSRLEAGSIGNSGNININAATLTLRDGAQVQTTNSEAFDTEPAGRGNAGNVNVKVTGLVDIAGENNDLNSGIFSSVETGTVGNGGNIRIDSGSLLLQDSARLRASTYGEGNAGNVTITVKDAIFLTGGQTTILSAVEAGGVGKGGNIDINAANLTLRDGAQLVTITREASDTQPPGKGDAGNINLQVSGVVDISGERDTFLSAIFSQVQTGTEGNGGNITVDADSFSLAQGAELNASTYGKGDAGNIQVRATDAVSLANRANILSAVEAGGMGKGGNIDINAATLTLRDGAQLITITREASDTQPPGKGDAGNINVKVSGAVDISGERDTFPSAIFSQVQTGTEGNGGNITVDTGSFNLEDGAELNASTFGNGNAGTIEVHAAEFFTVSDRIGNFSTGLFVNSQSTGSAKDITVNSPQITLDGGKLNSESFSGDGGNINLTSDLLLMRRGAEISTNAGIARQEGDGGNISINSKFIVALPQENSDITANAFSGAGGNVEILSQGIFGIEPRDRQTDKSDITASSELGVPGNLNLTDPDDSSIRNNLSNLPENQIDTNTIIANSCIVRSNEQNGTFLITGSGGLPQNPSDAPLSNYSTGAIRSIPSNTDKSPASNPRSWKIGDPVVEPQGVYKLPNGQLVLSRECS